MKMVMKMRKSKKAIIYSSIRPNFSIEMKTNSPVIPRNMGNTNHWLSRKRRRNHQAETIFWLMVAYLLLLPSVKIFYADWTERAIGVLVVARELMAAAQLQLVESYVPSGTLISCISPGRPLVALICAISGGRIGEGEEESPGSDPLDPSAILLFLNFYWVHATELQHEGTVRPLCVFFALLFVNEHAWFDKIQLIKRKLRSLLQNCPIFRFRPSSVRHNCDIRAFLHFIMF